MIVYENKETKIVIRIFTQCKIYEFRQKHR